MFRRGRCRESMRWHRDGETEVLRLPIWRPENGTNQRRCFYRRKLGYTVVVRRWKSAKLGDDVDLIGWGGKWLCFVEVKTRSRRDLMPAEAAVDRKKREMLRRMAWEKLRAEVSVRFDVVSV